MRGFLALVIAGAMSFVAIPIMYNLENDPVLFHDGLPPEAFTVRDHVYAVYQYSPLVGTGAIVVWMFVNAARRDVQDY